MRKRRHLAIYRAQQKRLIKQYGSATAVAREWSRQFIKKHDKKEI